MSGEGPRFRRHPDAAFRIIDGRAMIVVPATQTMHRLSEVGTFVWRTCDGKTVADIVAAIVGEFEVDEATARADLDAFAAELAEKRMLVIE